MLYSQGVSLEDLEIGRSALNNPRKVWRIFATYYYLFRGTPTRMWLDFAFQQLFGLEQRLSEETADLYFDTISEKLLTPEFRPRALYERFNLEVLATTDSPLDSLAEHQAIRESNWKARILPSFRPDPVVDPEFTGFAENIAKLSEKTGEDTSTWAGYLNALRVTRVRFRELGCTATDHGHPTARTANLPTVAAQVRITPGRQSRATFASAFHETDNNGWQKCARFSADSLVPFAQSPDLQAKLPGCRACGKCSDRAAQRVLQDRGRAHSSQTMPPGYARAG